MSPHDPFSVLGLEPSLDLDPDVLEERYLALSRESHPDHHAAANPGRLTEVLARSAAVNDAYRALKDRWSRARTLLDRADPAAFDAHKQLDPTFLAEAMEIAEEVAEVGDAGRAPLAARLRTEIDGYFARLGDALAAGDTAGAATLLHQSRYYRKALSDLTSGVGGSARGPR